MSLTTQPFVLTSPGQPVFGDAVRPSVFRAVVPLISETIGRYPPTFLSGVPLDRIVVCSDLSAPRRVLGTVDHEARTMFLSAGEPGAERVSAEALERIAATLHHELFHLLDGPAQDDEEWSACNIEGFEYGPEGVPPPDPPPAGFVTPYATTFVWEDKAELFSAMMTDPDALLHRARSDAALRAEVALMRSRIERRFLEGPLPLELVRIPLEPDAIAEPR